MASRVLRLLRSLDVTSMFDFEQQVEASHLLFSMKELRVQLKRIRFPGKKVHSVAPA